MSDKKDKEMARFDQKAEEISILFIPQCNDCEKNLGIEDCTEFHPKPSEYRHSEKECPKKSK